MLTPIILWLVLTLTHSSSTFILQGCVNIMTVVRMIIRCWSVSFIPSAHMRPTVLGRAFNTTSPVAFSVSVSVSSPISASSSASSFATAISISFGLERLKRDLESLDLLGKSRGRAHHVSYSSYDPFLVRCKSTNSLNVQLFYYGVDVGYTRASSNWLGPMEILVCQGEVDFELGPRMLNTRADIPRAIVVCIGPSLHNKMVCLPSNMYCFKQCITNFGVQDRFLDLRIKRTNQKGAVIQYHHYFSIFFEIVWFPPQKKRRGLKASA